MRKKDWGDTTCYIGIGLENSKTVLFRQTAAEVESSSDHGIEMPHLFDSDYDESDEHEPTCL